MATQLPPGIRSRVLDGVNGLRMHVLEAGEAGRDLVLLLHGFPELAYSWRRVMPPLGGAGFHVVAPDLRGFGATTGWDDRYDCDLTPFGPLNVAQDVIALVTALGHRSVRLLVGHDSGASVAATCALVRPDLFASVALMSAPFTGPSGPPHDLSAELSRLSPPRKHYQWYYGTRQAETDILACEQGVHAFFRAYYHMKSGDWLANEPHPLAAWSAEELAKLPHYYVMRADETMAQTVAHGMPSPSEIAACAWLRDEDLRVYSTEYGRTGFQGGLNYYRCRTSDLAANELSLFAGKTIDVPACFIAGARDWGIHQTAGALDAMRKRAFTRMDQVQLVPGAGHWVQQEAPGEVAGRLLRFIGSSAAFPRGN